MYRILINRTPVTLYSRQLSSTQPARKTVTERVSEVADKVCIIPLVTTHNHAKFDIFTDE